MNSNYGKSSNAKSGSLNDFDFDLGLNSARSRPLKEQKNPTSSYSSASSYGTYSSKPSTTSSWTHQPGKPSWTHQPASAAQSQSGLPGSLSGPPSMAGDIFGKSWTSSRPATGATPGIGIGKKDPNLFGDLVSSAIGQNKGNSNAPLKSTAPVGNKNTFSMGNVADSLPKTSSSVKTGGSWGSNESFRSYNSGFNVNSGVGGNAKNGNKSSNLGGLSMQNMVGTGVGGVMGSSKDPFGSLVDFGAKQSGGIKSESKRSNKSSVGDDSFGDFQNASKTSSSTFPSSNFSGGNNSSTGSNVGAAYSSVDDFGFSSNQPQSQPSVQSTGVNDFDALFSSTGGAGKVSEGFENQQFLGGDAWGLDSEFGGGHDTGGTTELEGLPPPPAGVSASTAKNKGVDNYKQGQYADAIKWLSWAVILLEKASDDAGTMEVLSCRASCYKEVGEYKKAVADCTRVLEHDGTSVSVLVQRALLYESMEKYKLGAEDLRTVMKLDPGNRVARSTIHRLTKMADQ